MQGAWHNWGPQTQWETPLREHIQKPGADQEADQAQFEDFHEKSGPRDKNESQISSANCKKWTRD